VHFKLYATLSSLLCWSIIIWYLSEEFTPPRSNLAAEAGNPVLIDMGMPESIESI
jgi:hypothetical protein